MSTDSIQDKERQFHDEWARSTDLSAIDVRAAFEAPTAMENRFILSLMGPLNGKRILDVGAGLGESSVYFALQGGDVTCTDLSPGMVETAVRLGQLHGVEIRGIVSPAESLGVEEASFDFVYVANAIHHIQDKRAFLAEVQKALKPGGRFFSIDPVVYNPVIEMYRRMATTVRTEDEAPLSHSDLQLVRSYFRDVGHCHFWILSLALFIKYYLLDRVHPNEDRYWKRIFRETPESLWWWRPLEFADRILTRIPLLQWLSWNIVMWGEK